MMKTREAQGVSSILELMRVLQFGDSVVPVGSFSFSNGLESAVQQGVVHDLETLEAFVATALEQAALSDGIALLCAHRAALRGEMPGIIQADFAVHNRKLSEEMRLMTVRMGRKLAELSAHVFDVAVVSDWLRAIQADEAPGCYPIAQALVFAGAKLTEHDAFAVHQYGLASMMLSAALRLMRVSHLDAQRILFSVNASAGTHYTRVASLDLESMASFTPVLDILASVHVKAHVRMFMN
jgi:urease accessory protein